MGWFLVAMVDVLERMDEQLYNEYRGIMAMLKPVSYTHLDVYKRQVYKGACAGPLHEDVFY